MRVRYMTGDIVDSISDVYCIAVVPHCQWRRGGGFLALTVFVFLVLFCSCAKLKCVARKLSIVSVV